MCVCLKSPKQENVCSEDSTPAVTTEMTCDVSTTTAPAPDPQCEAGLKPMDNEHPRSLQLSIRQASLPDSSLGNDTALDLNRPSSDPGLPGQ